MRADAPRHPVEVVTIGLDNDRPDRQPANHDVAFALVTRFNVRMNIGKRNRWSHLDGRHLAESADYDDFWMRRLALFERTCIPSVLAMSPRPDAWFVAFGDVDSWYVRELLERLRIYPWIHPYIRKKGEADDAGPLSALLSAYVHGTGKRFLCSTRFDSDDSLHQQFVGGLDRTITLLRERGFADEGRCLNFIYGLMQSAGELSVFLRRNNMFQSVFEPADEIKGPYQGSHDEIRHRMPIVEVVTNLPMWIYHRHGDTLEPAWVTSRDRLPLENGAAHYPMFGLCAESVSSLRPRDGGGVVSSAEEYSPLQIANSRSLASGLRDSAYWDASHVANAAELALSQDQPTLAAWLRGQPGAASAPKKVLQEFESGPCVFLNGGHLARLARELRACGEIVAALRVYNSAVLVSPSDRHLRAERDELERTIAFELDLDGQIELAGDFGTIEEQSSAVVFVASAPTDDVDALEVKRLRDRLDRIEESGLVAHLFLAPELSRTASEPELPDGCIPGRVFETLWSADLATIGVDAAYREIERQLAARVIAIAPCLLTTDGSYLAQRLAGDVGRGLGLLVDFSLGSDSKVERTSVSGSKERPA